MIESVRLGANPEQVQEGMNRLLQALQKRAKPKLK